MCTEVFAQHADAQLQHSLDKVIDDAVSDQRIVGTVVLVSSHGEIIYERAAGFADREAKLPMQSNEIFRLSSLSKTIVSTTALAMIEHHKLELDQPVTHWLPDFRPALPDGTTPEITIKELLNHTAGLSYRFLQPEDGPYSKANVSDGMDQPGLSLAENLKRIASVPLSYRPGTSWGYSMSADVLGAVIEKACGCTLPEAVSRHVTTPLTMHDTGFVVKDPSRLAVPYANENHGAERMGELQIVKNGPGFLRFAPARVFNLDSYPSGGIGMVGTAQDYWKLLETLRTGRGSILTPASVRAMTTDETNGRGPGPGKAFGYGMSIILDPTAAKTPQSPGTFAWGGVYGHSWFVDPSRGLTVIVLTNTTPEGLAGRFPTQIRDAVYAAQ